MATTDPGRREIWFLTGGNPLKFAEYSVLF